jgi:hypothetical protein
MSLTSICSFRVNVPPPATGMTVFGAGLEARGFPARTALTRVTDPLEPSPFEVQVLEMASAVSKPARRLTSATEPELVANPWWVPMSPPSVPTESTPVVSTEPSPGTVTDPREAVKGPPPSGGSDAEGIGPEVMETPEIVTSTRSPKAAPPKESTVARATWA